MRLEEESRKSKPIGRGADLRLAPRRNVRGEPNTGVRSQIPRPDFVVHRGPEEVPEKRPDLRRRRPPRDEQGQSVVSGRTACARMVPHGNFAFLFCLSTVLTLTISTEHDFRYISFQDLQQSLNRFSQDEVGSYSQMLFDVARNQVLVGAR
ncbi:hypothetical protein MTP99_019410 [Tenebrio molitor]|nr:hypothetical protein MTP99_019410 [Tenebrio molitor]